MKFALASILAVAVSATSLETASFWTPTKPTGPALTEWGVPENSSAPDFFGDLLGRRGNSGPSTGPFEENFGIPSETRSRQYQWDDQQAYGRYEPQQYYQNADPWGNSYRQDPYAAPQQQAYGRQQQAYVPQQQAYVPQQQAYAPQQQAYAPPQKYAENGNYNPWGAQQSQQQVSQPESKPISQTLKELMLPSSQEVPILSGGDFPDSDGQMMPSSDQGSFGGTEQQQEGPSLEEMLSRVEQLEQKVMAQQDDLDFKTFQIADILAQLRVQDD